MKPKSFSVIAAIITLLCPSTGNATVTQVDTPLETLIIVPCAAAGAGETVYLTGAAHMVFAVTHDANGGVHIATHVNTVGLSGVGLITGDKYQAFQQDSFISNSIGTGTEVTIVNTLRLTAPGPGNNLRIRQQVHVFVDANDEVTIVSDNFTSDCG